MEIGISSLCYASSPGQETIGFAVYNDKVVKSSKDSKEQMEFGGGFLPEFDFYRLCQPRFACLTD